MDCTRAYNSCGIGQVEGVGNKAPRTIMATVLSRIGNGWGNRAYFTFSAPIKGTRIAGLCEYIKKLDIGEVIEMPVRRNPNSGNDIAFVVWVVDQEKVRLLKEKASKRLTNRFKPGKEFRVRGNSVGHEYRLGSTVTFVRFGADANQVLVKEGRTYLSINDVVAIRKTK